MPSAAPRISDQSDVVAYLSDPATHGTAGPVDRIDTHAAIVFLAGDRVCKLKRAVTYPYLDYGTAELRRRACEAELALNRRTAPDLYLDVRAVRRKDDGGLTMGPDGEPIDWLVVMRRFDAEDLFDRMAETGRLTAPLLQRVTDRIVAFHETAEVAPGHGGSEALRRVVENNRDSMAAAGALLDQAEADALHRASIEALAALAPLLDRRRDAGKVRRCHGDLHLRNICLFGGEPTLFDCVEFSDSIACIDILYDLAFLLMDLWHRGLRAEANLVFNRYFDMSAETDGLPAIPLFLSIRAAIRAHVEAAAVATQTREEDREGRRTAARTYLALARDLLRPEPARLLAIGGLSGTGKTTLARALAPDLGKPPGARLLRSDVLRKRLAGVAPETRLPPSAYTREAGLAVYREVCEQAALALGAGFAAVADAVFADPAERQAIRDVADGARVPFTGFWLEAPAHRLAPRLAARIGDASDATPDVLDKQMGYDIGYLDWVRLDAGRGAEETARAARAELGLTSAPARAGPPPGPVQA